RTNRDISPIPSRKVECQREFDIGYDCGSNPWAFNNGLTTRTKMVPRTRNPHEAMVASSAIHTVFSWSRLMEFTTLKIAGSDAIRLLGEHRSRFPITGIYPFLIGDAQELERVKEAAGFHKQDAAAIIDASLGIDVASWMAERREET